MDTKEYIESGILELYVYGLLSESENEEVAQKAKTNKEINDEIISIEKAVLNISSSFSPFLSVDNFEKIKSKLEVKHGKVISMKQKPSISKYFGWVAAAVFLFGIGYFYNQQQNTQSKVVNLEKSKSELEQKIKTKDAKAIKFQEALSVVRDSKNTVVALTGQAVDINASAKVYWNKEKHTVYIDAAGLPEPPKGMVYQVWSLKLNPLTPTSIGLLDRFKEQDSRIFAVNDAVDAEAFGITLEPAGGSETPTMTQLYTLGKV